MWVSEKTLVFDPQRSIGPGMALHKDADGHSGSLTLQPWGFSWLWPQNFVPAAAASPFLLWKGLTRSEGHLRGPGWLGGGLDPREHGGGWWVAPSGEQQPLRSGSEMHHSSL